MNYDDETLMAYADGELDEKRRAEIAAAIERDPALARRIDQQHALREKISGAFTKVLDEPVPKRLADASRGGAPASDPGRGNVLQFPTRTARAPAAPWRAREWVAMAASVGLGVLLSFRIFSPVDSGLMAVHENSLVARGPLAIALDAQLASEQSGDASVLIGLTFKARDGNYCRSFVMRATRTAGLACRAGSDWQVLATDESVAVQGNMQQASTALPPSILRSIETRLEGAALDAEGERSAQHSGWKTGNP